MGQFQTSHTLGGYFSKTTTFCQD